MSETDDGQDKDFDALELTAAVTPILIELMTKQSLVNVTTTEALIAMVEDNHDRTIEKLRELNAQNKLTNDILERMVEALKRLPAVGGNQNG